MERGLHDGQTLHTPGHPHSPARDGCLKADVEDEDGGPTVGQIAKVSAREVFNTEGLPTVEVDVRLEDGSFSRNAATSGTSRGRSEAFDLRDGDASF